MRQDEPLCVEPEVTVHEVLNRLKEYKKGSVLICRGGKLQGVFTERDALRLMARGADLSAPIETVMTADPVTTSVSETVGAAIHKMAVGGYRRLPVVDDAGTPVGLLRVNHILHYLVEHFPEVVYNLPPKPHHTTQEREGA
jgi:CBS domain-containing protein